MSRAVAPAGRGRGRDRDRDRRADPVEERPRPPIDLRLAIPALAMWVGSAFALALGLLGGWLITGISTGILVAIGLPKVGRWFTGRPRIRPSRHLGPERCSPQVTRVVVGALIFLALGSLVSTLRTWAAGTDPLVLAAESGQRVTAELRIISLPDRVPDTFGANLSSSGFASQTATDQSQQRYRLSAVADSVQTRQAGLDTRMTSQVTVTVYATGSDWAVLLPGQRIKISGYPKVSDFEALPAVSVTVRGPVQILSAPNWHAELAAGVRKAFVDRVKSQGQPAEGLLAGIVLGDTEFLQPQLEKDAKAAGLAHLLAVSGSHFALLCGLALVLLSPCGPRVAASGSVLLIGVLVLVIPAGPSVYRAAVMGFVAALALTIGRGRNTLPALATAIIGLLSADSRYALDPGFALSVLATAGIVLVAPVWSDILRRKGWPIGWANVLVIPVVAQLATMPVVASISGQITVMSVIANIMVLPVVGPLLVVGAISVITSLFAPTFTEWLVALPALMAEWIAYVARTVASWPMATIPWPDSTLGSLSLAGLVLITILALRSRRARIIALTVATTASIIIIPSQTISWGWPPADWIMVACDIGQGDGFVISTGIAGEGIVVDTGPEPTLIDQCLDRLEITRIPLLVLTHPHLDHIGGLAGALNGRRVGVIGVGPMQPGAAARTISVAASQSGATMSVLEPDQIFRIGSSEMEILGPLPVPGMSYWEPNDQSIVARVTVHGTRILLTGDVEELAQRALLDARADLSAQVFKVPHHGSAKLLPEFVNRVHAQVAVISVGADNDFGHPSDKALRLLADGGIRSILRTDQLGDIAIMNSAIMKAPS